MPKTKTSPCVGPPQREPHRRLKALRKIIGCTQAKLAEKCGISYSYLLSVETGQRTMSEQLAKRIACATGVSKSWLMNAPGTTETPQDFRGEYTKKSWEGHRQWDGNKFPDQDFGDIGDELMFSDEVTARFAAALRASWRKGKLNIALMLSRDFVESMTTDLKIVEAAKTESLYDAPHELVHAEYEGGERPYRNSLHHLMPLLSPYARYKWCRAFAEGGDKAENFVSEMEDLSEMIGYSFTLKRNEK